MSYKYIAVIGVDGMGSFNRLANTPNMDGIFAGGAETYDALSLDPTISAQNWGAMLLGMEPIVHKLTNGYISSAENTGDSLKSVFRLIRQARPGAYLASCCNWNPINHGIIEHNVGADLRTADCDEKLLPEILDCVGKKPDFLFVQFDDVDGAGHGGGYGKERHIRQIEITDGYIGKIYDAYRENGMLDDTLFIVTADHGGIRTGHGGYSDEEKYIYIGAAGKYVPHGQIGFAKTKDIAATVLYALGVKLPDYDENGFTGQVPEGIFPEYKGVYKRVCPAPHNVANEATPPVDGENGLYSFVDRDKLMLVMFFDYDLRDATGRCVTETVGKPKFYSEGIRGAQAELGKTGYARIKGAGPEGSFTVACWLKIDRITTEAIAVFGNKEWFWRNRDSRGFMLALRCNDVVVNFGCGDDNDDVVTPFPEEISEGWIHCTAAVDYEKHEISVYYNFKHIQTAKYPEKYFYDMSSLPLTVGNDATGTHNSELYEMLFNVDDLLLVKGVMTREEVKKLGAYYGM